jgi:DNA-binding SARP family transcriptional activator
MEFQILGPVRVSAGDRAIDIGSPKQRRVLASLLIRANHAVSVERLVDELWGDEPPDDPLAALHAYISRLRRALDPDRRRGGNDGMLVRAPPGYRLQVDEDHIDACRFERLADEGRRAREDGDSESAARLLESALALWRGDAFSDLAGYSVARTEATRLEQIRLRAIEDLFDALLALGRHDSVASEAVTVLADHPYLERVRGQLMLALYRCDRQADSLRAYREGREILLEQLGIDPSPALQQLEDDILLQKPHLDWRPPPELSQSTRLMGGLGSTMPRRQRRSEFVGRDKELGVLVESWRRAVDGERQLVVVTGEPGIGKTRLASELATMARREGGTVLCGGAHLGSVVPYQPFAEALDSYAAEVSPVELRDAIADDGSILAKLAPGLLGRIATAAAAIQAEPSTERFLLFDAAARVLQRIAARGPLLVVLDDLQWADPGSWLLVVHLARLPVDVRLLLVVTLREPVTDVDHVAMLAGLRRDGAGELNLRGLDERAVGGLIAAHCGPAQADEVRAEIAARSSGNPFYVEQLLAHTEESAARAGSDPEGVAPLALGVPQGVLDVIGQRVTALSAPARGVLAAASVVGQVFDLDLVAAVMGLGAGDLLDHLDEAVAAGLIRERPGSIGHYRFSHALTRDALYAGFTETRRAHLHQQIGEALEALGRRGQVGELAHHLLLGRADPVRAATYACLAGHQALDQLAHEEAADVFERGLQVLAGGDEGGDVRVDLFLGVVEARGRAGRRFHRPPDARKRRPHFLPRRRRP